jgi:L-ribulose-5-phosphate 4-epimerase
MFNIPPGTGGLMLLERLRHEVWAMNMQLPKNNLVTWTSGNVSGRDAETGYVVIKPSGVPYEELSPEKMAIVDPDGNIVEADFKPSVDTGVHLYIYRHRPDVGGVAHTHSPYATSFSVLGQPIPVALTTISYAFGGPIPVGEYAPPGDVETGREILRSIGRSKAILMKNHGPFTIGATPTEAVKLAVMLEEAAKTLHLAFLRGQPDEVPPEDVERGYRFYHTEYGQSTGQ